MDSEPSQLAPHWSVQRLAGLVKDYAGPSAEFAAAGPWTHTYAIWVASASVRTHGTLTLKRTPVEPAQLDLEVELLMRQAVGSTHRTAARLRCLADQLCTPVSWRVESTIVDRDGQPVPFGKVSEVGRVDAGVCRVSMNGREFVRASPTPFTCNWSIFEAVQRLGALAKPLEFALLEDMDLVKPEQRLSAGREGVEIRLGSTVAVCREYEQLGRGVLPWHYWVDQRGRLVLAFSGLRAYVLTDR